MLDTLSLLAVLVKIPLVLRVVLLHVLHLSPQARYLDLRTALVVAVIRSFLQPSSRPLSISSVQGMLSGNQAVKGRIWIATYASPVPPEPDAVRAAVRAAFDGLLPGLAGGEKKVGRERKGQDDGKGEREREREEKLRLPGVVPVEAEWTGYRAGATEASLLPPVPERQKYDEMVKETKSPLVVLYFHGGVFYLMDPATHRPSTKRLAKITGGCVYSVRYRLAPQHAFPAALMDAFISYLTLLYPPPGAFHEPVKPEHVVLAGDSAGANLCLALTQLLLELRRQHSAPGPTTVLWHGAERELALPAGLALMSPWCDITHSMPSYTANEWWDYLPAYLGRDSLVRELSRRPPCEAWPAKPPRAHIYVDGAFLAHPLVTVMAARSWAGAPPVYMCVGWELLADEAKYMAAKLHADGVPVVFEEYEAMPHCSAMIFPRLRESRRCFDAWAGFINTVASGGDSDGEPVKSRFVTVKAKTLQEVEIDAGKLSPCKEEEMRERLARQVLRVLGKPADATLKL